MDLGRFAGKVPENEAVERETQGCLAWLAATAIFVVATWYTWEELSYAVWGRVVEGRIATANEVVVTGSKGRSRRLLLVRYEFVDQEGRPRTSSEHLPVGWTVPPDRTILVDSIAGASPQSRIHGRPHWLAVTIFVVALLAVIAFSVRLWREATDAKSPRKFKGRPQRWKWPQV